MNDDFGLRNLRSDENPDDLNESEAPGVELADSSQTVLKQPRTMPVNERDSIAQTGSESQGYQPSDRSDEKNKTEKIGVVEALLFISAEPLSVSRISEITGFDPGAVREMINKLIERYDNPASGLVIREVAGGFGIYSRPEVYPYVSRFIRLQYNPRLTRAALETMAIVAYLQPVSRSTVAEIRGVQSEGVMKTLEERGLIEPVGRGPEPGYPVLYGTTAKFLERFGLKSIDELPDLESFAPDEETIERIRRIFSQEISDGEALYRGGEEGTDTENTC